MFYAVKGARIDNGAMYIRPEEITAFFYPKEEGVVEIILRGCYHAFTLDRSDFILKLLPKLQVSK